MKMLKDLLIELPIIFIANLIADWMAGTLGELARPWWTIRLPQRCVIVGFAAGMIWWSIVK